MKFRAIFALLIVLAILVPVVSAQEDAQTTGLVDRTTLFSLYGGTAIATITLGIMNYVGQASKTVRLIVVILIGLIISIGTAWFIEPDPEVFLRIIITIANTIMITGSTLGINEFGNRAQGGGTRVAGNKSVFDSILA
jgi:hypothetical protein